MTCSFEKNSIHNKRFSATVNLEKEACIMCFHSDLNPPRTRCVIAQAQLIICVWLSYKQLCKRFADHSCVCK